MAPPEDLAPIQDMREKLIRIESAVERIGEKLDDKFAALTAAIQHGDRETLSVVNMLKQDLEHLKKEVADIEADVKILKEEDLEEVKEEVEHLNRWRSQVVGFAIGSGALTGGVVAAIIKVTGG